MRGRISAGRSRGQDRLEVTGCPQSTAELVLGSREQRVGLDCSLHPSCSGLGRVGRTVRVRVAGPGRGKTPLSFSCCSFIWTDCPLLPFSKMLAPGFRFITLSTLMQTTLSLSHYPFSVKCIRDVCYFPSCCKYAWKGDSGQTCSGALPPEAGPKPPGVGGCSSPKESQGTPTRSGAGDIGQRETTDCRATQPLSPASVLLPQPAPRGQGAGGVGQAFASVLPGETDCKDSSWVHALLCPRHPAWLGHSKGAVSVT